MLKKILNQLFGNTELEFPKLNQQTESKKPQTSIRSKNSPTVVTMPLLYKGMKNAQVKKWFVKEGDQIEEGNILCEIETKKANMEFESFESGTVLYIHHKEGANVNVNSILVVIGQPGEHYKHLLK